VRHLIDSDVLIDALTGSRNAPAVLDALSDDGLAVSVVSLAELYEGTYRSANPETAQQAIKDLLSGYEMLNLSDAIVATFGRLRALLRRQGRLIPDLDLMIASTALAHDLTLVTRNQRHFSRVPQLRLYLPIDQG